MGYATDTILASEIEDPYLMGGGVMLYCWNMVVGESIFVFGFSLLHLEGLKSVYCGVTSLTNVKCMFEVQ